jgi:hypothetical protein
MEQGSGYVPTAPQRDIDSASQIQETGVSRLIVVAIVLICDQRKVKSVRKILGDTEPATGDLRISQNPKG